MTIKESSVKWEIRPRRINILCNEDQIEGASKIGDFRGIPADAEKSKDERIMSGKYAKSRG